MDDPWEKACEERLNNFAHYFLLPEKSMDPQQKLNFGQRYLGHLVYNHRAESVEAIDNLVDAIVFQVSFSVFQNGKLKYDRRCYKDNAKWKTEIFRPKLLGVDTVH